MKKIKNIVLVGVSFLLVGCGNIVINNNTNDNSEINSVNTETNDVTGKEVMNQLAYQTTTSITSLSSLSMNNGLINSIKARKDYHDDNKKEISTENKEKIENILPTLNILLQNDNKFESSLVESDKEEYEYKQVITFSLLNEEVNSYVLYYNLEFNDVNDDVEDLPNSKEEIENNSSDINNEETTDSSSEEIISEDNVIVPETEINMKKGDDHHYDKDYDKHNDFFKRDDKERNESITVFKGIALINEEEFSFIGKSSEEVEDEEVENKFALKIFNSSNSSIKVVHEKEVEENSIEEKYSYTVYEDKKIVDSFTFENESGEVEEAKIKLIINDERYSFKVYEIEGDTYIRVKFDKRHEDEGKLIYKVVITVDENGTSLYSFEEVINNQ